MSDRPGEHLTEGAAIRNADRWAPATPARMSLAAARPTAQKAGSKGVRSPSIPQGAAEGEVHLPTGDGG